MRRVVVPLPFVATKATLDDQTRDLSPPSEVAAFEVPREGGMRHRVTAIGTDGARAEAYVVEADGVARPDGAGFTVESLDYDDEDAGVIELGGSAPKRPKRPKTKKVQPNASTSAKPAANVKVDGFTKLK